MEQRPDRANRELGGTLQKLRRCGKTMVPPPPDEGQAFGLPRHPPIYAPAAIILPGPLRIDLGLNHRRDVVRYVFITLVAAVSSTIIGVVCLVADHTISWLQFWGAAFSWFSGDSIAFVGVAPFLLIHVFPWVRHRLLLSVTKSTARHKRPKEGDAALG